MAFKQRDEENAERSVTATVAVLNFPPNAFDYSKSYDGSGTNAFCLRLRDPWRTEHCREPVASASTSRLTRGLPAHSPLPPCDGPAQRIMRRLARRNPWQVDQHGRRRIRGSMFQGHDLCMVFFAERREHKTDLWWTCASPDERVLPPYYVHPL